MLVLRQICYIAELLLTLLTTVTDIKDNSNILLSVTITIVDKTICHCYLFAVSYLGCFLAAVPLSGLVMFLLSQKMFSFSEFFHRVEL